MKKLVPISVICCAFVIFGSHAAVAQRDVIFKKDSTQLRCRILKTTQTKYEYAYVDAAHKIFRTSVAKAFVDSVSINFYPTDLIVHHIFEQKAKSQEEVTEVEKDWTFNFALGLNVGNILEFNNPSGTDKKNISLTTTLDLGLNYGKEENRFAMTNELHYIFGLQKSGFSSTDHIQRISDNLNILQDISVAVGKTKKWNFNLITKSNTSIFSIYDGDYFKDVNNLGKIQGFLSPYDVTISPGFKYQANQYLRISLSPYSFNLYGVRNAQIANKGLFITELDGSGNYKKFLFSRLGAEFNIWYDRKVKKWLDMQYRVGISSNYFEDMTKNGMLNGLFITKVRLLSNLYLTHRATLNGNLSVKPFKPYYSQVILLSYSKSM